MADNTENVLVEFDYQNIFVVDPNKVIDKDGKAKERLVKHENLVMYANLETTVIPRTKLANGIGNNDAVENIKVASINFLNPGNKKFYDNSYTDEITGRSSPEGRGANQVNYTGSTGTQFIQGVSNITDNGMLGITSIEVKVNTSFLPTIRVELEDVKGRAMFEAGDNSPYAAFFNLPYPLFYLTLKGYYGKAIRLPLMLQNFTSRYDTSNGNYKISLTFYTYKYTVMSEISMGYLLSAPHMYKTNLKIESRPTSNSTTKSINSLVVEKGYQKVKEVYADYKSKGLIDDNFPELTINELIVRLDNFTKRIVESFSKQNLDAITNIEKYRTKLLDLQKKVFYGLNSWYKTYLDYNNPYVSSSPNNYKFYKFKDSIIKADAFAELKKIISENIIELNENPTVGTQGKYTVNGKEKYSPINVTLEAKSCVFRGTYNDIDWTKTYEARKGRAGTPAEVKNLEDKEKLTKELFDAVSKAQNQKPDSTPEFYMFESPETFNGLCDGYTKQLQKWSTQIQDDLTNALASQLQNSDTGIGFIPSIRNSLAVVFANGEAFLRLMEDVHVKAWNVRENKERKNAIFNGTPTSDNTNDSNGPIYPWPQYLEETTNEKSKEKYELKYPGNVESLSKTKAYRWDLWPEVEFVEEFIKGYIERTLPAVDNGDVNNQKNETSYIALDAIQTPILSEIYQNKDEVKFIYEIYERIFVEAFYSKLGRGQSSMSGVYQSIAEAESSNIVTALGYDNPFLIVKLKSLNIDSNNFIPVLFHISNNGTGESWQNHSKGILNTTYLKNFVKNAPFAILSKNDMFLPEYNPQSTIKTEPQFKKYIEGTTTNVIDFSDTYPFTNKSWLKSNMSNGYNIPSPEIAMDTTDTLVYNDAKKKTANFNDNYQTTMVRPVTNFNYGYFTPPTQTELYDLKTFYQSRIGTNTSKQYATEGTVYYLNYSGNVSATQTTSMLNTPYFINSIIKGVDNYRSFNPYPYREAAYLFINSLPLTTLKEKYVSLYGKQTPLKYMFASFKKMGALHRLPYAWILKYGSIWNRYKNWKDTGVDYINDVWTDFDYLENYDPVTKLASTIYSFSANGVTNDIVLEQNLSTTASTSTIMNIGFYPKLINYFSFFYQGFFNLTGYTNTDIQNEIDIKSLSVFKAEQPNINLNVDSNKIPRTTNIIRWSTILNKDENKSFILPSWGNYGFVNQIQKECFNQVNLVVLPKLNQEILGNKSIYNGSVRLFWSSPNYGYFNNGLLKKPTPEQYIKEMFVTREEQDNFSITGSGSSYSDISEMFSVFEKNILDRFEQEFLNYSKAVYDFNYESEEFSLNAQVNKLMASYIDYDCNTGLSSVTTDPAKQSEINNIANALNISVQKLKDIATGVEQTTDEKPPTTILSYRNFHHFMRNFMLIDKPTAVDSDLIVQQLQQEQNSQLISGINGMMEYDIIFKNGNPSNFDYRTFDTFSSNPKIEPYTYKGYYSQTPNTLPVNGGTITLTQSKNANPETWAALEEYVGFSNIPQLKYSNNGSYITDFFVDMDVAFSIDNIKLFSQIIKIYATQKLSNPNMTQSQFLVLMDNYLNGLDEFKNNIINSTMTLTRAALPYAEEFPQDGSFAQLEGPQTRDDLWQTFKALNDKWIAGTDFNNKTLFEDVLFLDRASRDIGDKVLIDIFKFKDLLKTTNPKMTMQNLIQSVIVDNHFVIFSTPSYVNFYNVQDATKNPIPKIEGSLEFANTLFGTFTEVDYTNTGPKMVCLFAGPPSNYLDLKENTNLKLSYKSDAFDLRRSSDNPLIENQIGKKDWDKSNRVVGFNVDIGVQNQQIFHNFSVSQENGKNTAESLQVTNMMANVENGNPVATQNNSLYNIYRNRSYTCSVQMMGNAIIQPTMYFNLRHVPMFSGPYLILEVSHSIKPGSFETTFQGIRQPVYSVAKIDNLVQSIKQNLLQSVITKAKAERKRQEAESNTIQKQQKDAVKATDSNKKPTNDTTNTTPKPDSTTNSANVQSINSVSGNCSNKLFSAYQSVYNQKSNPKQTKITFQRMYDYIKALTSDYTNNEQLSQIIFITMYLNCGNTEGFNSYENNYSGVKLTDNWGNATNCSVPPNGSSLSYFPSKDYMCLATEGGNIGDPYGIFRDEQNNIQMLVARWYNRDLPTLNNSDSLLQFWYCNFGAVTKKTSDYQNFKTTQSQQQQQMITKVENGLKVYKGLN